MGLELLRLARDAIEYGLIHRKPLPINCDELPRALTDDYWSERLESQRYRTISCAESAWPGLASSLFKRRCVDMHSDTR